MIEIDNATRPPDTALLDSEGGFLWWYAQVLDADLNGAVLIWSFGLPFLPGLASAARRGEAVAPRMRPSLNLVVYRRGRPDFYILQEFEPERAAWDGQGEFIFGDSRIRVTKSEGRTQVDARIDMTPSGTGERVLGHLRAEGPMPLVDEHAPKLGMTSAHHWTPLALPAFGTVRLRMGDEHTYSVAGRAYVDRNSSDRPLHELGIDTWIWGHAATDDGERVFYVLLPEDGSAPQTVGFGLDRTGKTTILRDIDAHLQRRGRTTFGMPKYTNIRLERGGKTWLDLPLQRPLDSGPFYLRYGAHPSADGCVRHGMAEVIRPSRIDLWQHRPLVRMRVDRASGPNSMWLPLFEGPRTGRITRLLRHWLTFRPLSARRLEV